MSIIFVYGHLTIDCSGSVKKFLVNPIFFRILVINMAQFPQNLYPNLMAKKPAVKNDNLSETNSSKSLIYSVRKTSPIVEFFGAITTV